MKNDFLIAITQVCAERHLPKEVVLEAIEQALVHAYKRNFGTGQNIEVKIDPNTGKARVFAQKEVVEKVKDPRIQISLQEARQIDAMAKVGSIIRIELTPKNFGRIAAQTAKQVILQRIREAERETMYADWSDREGEDVLGTVRNIDSAGNVILSLGRVEAVMPKSEQIPTEHYTPNQKIRAYIYEVEKTNRGPRIKVSRTHQKLLRRLLENEVPEIYQGTVEIKGIAREPGSRSKVAVAATQPGVDPVGSCVGMRGVRIQNIVNELNGEKIDVVAWSADEKEFIANALSPAKVEHVWLDRETKTATVVVPDNQLSLAIGKEGQNARLAAKLTNWRIDIKSLSEAAEEIERRAREAAEAAARERELAAKREAALALLAEAERSLAQEEQEIAEMVGTAEEALPSAEPAVAQEAAVSEPTPTLETAVASEQEVSPAQVAQPEGAAPLGEATVEAPEEAATVLQAAPEFEEPGEIRWEFEKEYEEEEYEPKEGKRHKGKGKKKGRLPQRRASRHLDWQDELEEW
ncbi:MAG: transcription termination/antitermination protein NusA [Chloroflexi bacterium]|nr:transcription termination/antitermination protein NusA [Chloroflexota bacterium]